MKMIKLDTLLGAVGQKHPWIVTAIVIIALMVIYLVCHKAGKSIGHFVYYLFNP